MAVTEPRRQELRGIVQKVVTDALNEDLEGGESIMKEAWERCTDAAEMAIMRRELVEIIRRVQDLE